MKNLIITSILLLLGLAASQTTLWGSHLQGYDIGHEVVGANQIKIKVRQKLVCAAPPPANPQILIGIIALNGAFNSSIYVNTVNNTTQTLSINSVSSDCNGGLIPDMAFRDYEGVFTIPPSLIGEEITFSIDDCCMDPLMNLINGSLNVFTKFIPHNHSDTNHSPLFLSNLSHIVPLGSTVSFQLPNFDLDGDSLSYAFASMAFSNFNSPRYLPPFTFEEPMGANVVRLDTVTGIYTINSPMIRGEFGLLFQVNEYRNGRLIGVSQFSKKILVILQNTPQPKITIGRHNYLSDENFSYDNSGTFLKMIGDTLSKEIGYVMKPCVGDSLMFVLTLLGRQDSIYQESNLTSNIPGASISYLPSPNAINETFVIIEIPNVTAGFKRFNIIAKSTGPSIISSLLLDFYVVPQAVPQGIPASSTGICLGVNNNITLNAPHTSTTSAIRWEPTTLFNGFTGPNPTISISQPTTVNVTIENIGGFCNNRTSQYIGTVQQSLQVAQIDSCWGVPVRFSANTGPLNGTYQWSPAGLFAGQTSNVASAVIALPTNVGVTYTDVAGCTASSSLLGASVAPLGMTVTADQPLICIGDIVRLSALMAGDSMTRRLNLNQYDVSAIPVAPINTAGFTTISLTDDSYSSNIPLGFAFTYFGYRYDSCFISSNGFITFGSPSYALGNAPLPHPAAPSNMIALAWGDLDPSIGGSISYATQGTAPNRRFIIRYDQVPFYANPISAPSVSGFIVLYESTNTIDIISTNIQHNNANLTQGIQNSNGGIAFTVPGRNMALWNASFNAFRFTNTTTFEHEPNFVYSWNNTPNFQPYPNNPYHIVTQNTTYTVTATSPSGCNVMGSVSVSVKPRTSSSSASNMTCGLPNGTATATGGASYFWNNGATTPQTTGLSAGRYIVNIIEPNGCDFNDTLNILNPFLSAYQSLSVTQTSPPSCSPATVTFGASVASPLPGTFSWLPTSVFGNQTGPSATAVLNEPTNITLVYSEQGGCSVTRTILSNNSSNNLTVSASATSVCAGGTVTLNSLREGDSGDFSGRSYSVAPIPYQPVISLTPINCTLTSGNNDDGFSTVNLGFTFTYFGQTYTQAHVGTNGYLTFGSGARTWISAPVPSSAIPNNAIYLVGGDLIATNGSMRYEVLGTAPNRRFVLYFSNEDLNNNNVPQVAQLVLYEGTNEIDIINIDIDYGDYAVQGIENASGTYALPVPGRNFTTFTSRGNAYRFTSVRDTITTTGYRYRWSGLSNASINYHNNVTTTVNQNTVFTVTSYDSLGCAVTGTVSVNAIPRQSSISSTPETCNGQDGAATASGGTAYVWSNGSTSASATGLSSGFTYVTITEPNGCVIPDSVFVGSAFGLAWGIQTTNANCQVADGTAIVNPPSSGGPFTLSWSNGDTGNSVTGLAPGWYSATISNASGCRSHRNFEIRENSNCFWRIEGYVYNDHAAPDCAPDLGSSPEANAIVRVSNSLGSTIGYAVTDSTGFYSYEVRNAGRFYNVDYIVSSYANAIPVCPNTLTVSITASQRVSSGNNFYIDYLESSDAEVTAHVPRMRALSGNTCIASVRNVGNTVLSGTLTLEYSSFLVYSTNNHGVTVNQTARTITWSFNGLERGESRSFSGFFTPSFSTQIGDTFLIRSIVHINGNDVNPANDTFVVTGNVLNSFDPNEKSVFPQGSGPEHGILESQRKLTYNIDFENLGNDTAYAVLIHDVIDTTKLDIRSVRPIASSHDFEMGIKGLDTLTFHFQDINLLARSQDPQKAKGFVAFSIDLRPGLPVGTRIENRASIFFDYNAAIVTNTAYNTIVRPSGIEAPTLSLSAKLFPNPTNANATLEIDLDEGTELRIAVLDMMGKAVGNSQQSTWLPGGRHQFTLDSEQWPAGMYFVQLVTPKGVVALPMQVVR